MCNSMNSSSTNETDGSGMSAVAVALCLSVTIFGDDIVEGEMEYINVTFTSLDDQGFFVGPTLAQVFIMDDDGEQSRINLLSNASSEPYYTTCKK